MFLFGVFGFSDTGPIHVFLLTVFGNINKSWWGIERGGWQKNNETSILNINEEDKPKQLQSTFLLGGQMTRKTKSD